MLLVPARPDEVGYLPVRIAIIGLTGRCRMTLLAFFLAVVGAALPASAADYPTTPDDIAKMCEVIGEVPNLSIPSVPT